MNKNANKLSDTNAQKLETFDFKVYLQNELVERCKKNKAYSLRSFARSLELDASTLSQVLRGKRSLAPKSMLKLAPKLGLGPSEIAAFSKREPRLSSSQAAHELTLDSFKVIADWYHYAIFELVTTKDFQPDDKWIAKTLSITVTEAHVAVERLQRIGLIEIGKNGKWSQGPDLITTVGNPFTTSAFRLLQKQVLEQALLALEETPMEHRDQSSMTMAINKKRLPEAKIRIKKFRRELCKFLQQDRERDSVYQLGVSLFPLTKIETKKDDV